MQEKEIDQDWIDFASEFETILNAEDSINALDVRRPGEYEAEHLEATLTRPLDYINDWTTEVAFVMKPITFIAQDTAYDCSFNFKSSWYK